MIRNLTIISALLILPFVSYGQTEKGSLLLGGGIDLGSTTYKRDNFNDQKVFSLNINPGLSYFVADNVALGIILPISIYNQTQDGSAETKSQSLAFGPTLRYYFPFNRMAVFPLVSYRIGGGKLEAPTFDPVVGSVIVQNEKYATSNFKVGAGLAFFLSNSVALEAILSYNKTNTDYDSDLLLDLETTSVGFDLGFQIYLQANK